MSIISLQNVSKTYGEGEIAVHALRGVDLTIEQGDFVAVAGPSGSGKSTMLNIMSGLDRPTEGNCHIAGTEITQLSSNELSKLRLEKVGFIFQAYNLLPVLTALENTEYVMMMQGVPAQERAEKAKAILARVGLDGKGDRFPHELSGGQQQRVAVARAIVSEPVLVLADEPTANLDSETGYALMDLMGELNQEKGTTFIFSTHDPKVMERSNEIIRLHDGKILSRDKD
ncbi:MAG: ABC transporter ATP-binding protein [Myxococcota bacterium]|nr:ABC transporter ATP-binding protein [Myxococcota bacterium]